MKNRLAMLAVLITAVTFALTGCVTMPPSESNFQAPTVNLSSIQPSYYEGFWYYGKAEPAMGKAPKGGGSSAVTLDFVFDIHIFNIIFKPTAFVIAAEVHPSKAAKVIPA